MRIALVIAAAGLASQAAWAQNLLANPDLDQTSVSSQILATPTNWVASASLAQSGAFNDGLSSEGFANWQQPGGQGVFFKAFQGTTGNRLNASLTQTVPGSAGFVYTFSGFAGVGAGYIGLSDPSVSTLFAIQFLDGANAVIGGNSLNLVAAGLGTPNGNPFRYSQFSLSSAAPAGTASVRVGVFMENAYGNPAGGDQAFVVDSFSLVPAPGSLALLGLAGLGAARRRR